MDKKIIKRLIIILLIIFVCIIYVVIRIGKEDAPKKDYNNTENNNITDNNNNIENNTTKAEESGSWKEKPITNTSNKEENKLEEVEDEFSYFLIKQCLSNFYNTQSREKAINMIDQEAKELLNINKDNIPKLYENFNSPEFCIDKIYKQKIDISKDIYVVYNRLQKNTKNDTPLENRVVFVKIDKKNVTFSVYPYEYLKNLNYLKLTKDDKIEITNLNEIIGNDANQYKTDLIIKDDQVLIKEFYDRFKFEIQFDIIGLYDKIDKNYKEERFKKIDEFKNYVVENKNKIVNSEITKYKVTKSLKYTEYVVICDKNTYIFDAKNIMNYTVLLDIYTAISEDTKKQYNSSLPNVKAKYCVKRVINALNNKDYDFVYSHLDVIQKNNKQKNIQEFKNFVDKIIFEQTAYELDEDYIEIAKNVYQYNIKLTDKTEKEFMYRRIIITVTLGENEEFFIGITN